MTNLTNPPEWTSPSPDPRDETFGDVVEPADLDVAGAYDAVLVGVPYDGGVMGRRGASDGPRKLRELLSGTKTRHLGGASVDDVGDLGDVDLPAPTGIRGGSAGVAETQDYVAEAAAAIYRRGAFPVFLGGDNATTVGHVRPLLGDRSVGVISVDAHLDCREVHGEPSSGTPYRQLLEEGLAELCVVGARHFETSPDYVDWARDRGVDVVPAERVARDLDDAVETARRAMEGVDYAYLSLDLDALDETAAPGVSAPTPGGLASREAFELCRRLGGLPNLAGFEVVECAPGLEPGDRTARAGAVAVAHLLAGRRAAGQESSGAGHGSGGANRRSGGAF